MNGPIGISLLLLTAMLTASGLVFPQLSPDALVAVHFGLDGKPDRFASPLFAVSIIPAAALFTLAVFVLAPRFERRRNNLMRSSRAYATTWVATMVVLCAAHGLLLARALSADVSVSHGMTGALGLLLIATGNSAGKIRPNGIFGIRTPWTLRNQDNWIRTHRLYGWLSVASGLLLLMTVILARSPQVVSLAGLATVPPTIALPFGYSWWLARSSGATR